MPVGEFKVQPSQYLHEYKWRGTRCAIASADPRYHSSVHKHIHSKSHHFCFAHGKYDDLNKNGPYSLIYLNTWFIVDGTVRKGFRGLVLLEEVCHSGVCFGVSEVRFIPI